MQKIVIAVISFAFALVGVALIIMSLIPSINPIRLIVGLAFVLSGIAAYISGNAYLKK